LTAASAVVALVLALGGVAWLLRPVDRPVDSIRLAEPGTEEQKTAPAPPPRSTPLATTPPAVPVLNAQAILTAINASRAQERLAPLVVDARLSAAAQEKLDDMLKRRYFDHKNPEGKYVWDTLMSRCAFRMTAENLARGIADAGAMERSWMDSPAHRENILNPQYRLTGIAVAQNPLTAVVLFADRCE
jgi:uncharacterized protein YkwD